MSGLFRRIDRRLRALAHDVLDRRDGISGWKPHRDAFLATARKDASTLQRDVLTKLRNIVEHAYATSPYYREQWQAIGFVPAPDFGLEDLQRLPFLTKDILREHKARLVSERFRPEQLELSYTGGTTGTQTAFYLDHGCVVARVGRQWGILELCGYRPGMRRALIWGVHTDLLPEGVTGGLKRRFRHYASSQEVLCCTVMSEQALQDYHERLRRFRPEVIYGYPSAIAELATFIRDRGLEPIRVRTIITTAERLAKARRRLLQETFGGEVYDLYCTREYGCVAFECSVHQGMHIDAESVLVEITRDGKPVPPGQPGEITITDLQNYGMPFIRSRTGDLGVLSTQPCACGSALPLLKGLDGRDSEVLYRPDGSVVAGLMLADLFMDMPPIQYAQFVQEKLNELDVLVVASADLSEEVEREAIRQVREIMGEEMTIRIRRVDDIARSERSGKYLEVICKLSRQDLPRRYAS